MINNDLEGLLAYLCGPIDHADDDGVGWRRTLTEELSNRYAMKTLDPTNKPFKGVHGSAFEEIGNEKQNALDMRSSGDYESLAEKMRMIVRIDLRMVDLSDLLIAYIPKGIRVCGSIHEIVTACESKKPTLIVFEGGREEASNWYWGMLPTTPHTDNRSGWIFDSWDALFEYLDEINEGKNPEPKLSRWVILDGDAR